MKNYYELTKNERDKYLKEFKKTPIGKEMKRNIIVISIIAIAILALDLLCTFVLEEYNEVGNPMLVICFIVCGYGILYDAYMKINFSAWLKNKYDIKRW